jgi:hypothetical protein
MTSLVVRVSATFQALLLVGLTSVNAADALRVRGTAGYLSEWELNADVTSAASGAGAEFSGPLMLKHVGVCSPGGPVEKTGKITVQISKALWASSIEAVLLIDGLQCKYKGKLSTSSEGFMNCADGNAIPLTLTMK